VRRLYSLLTVLLAPVAFAAVLWRGLRDRAYRQGLGERFGWGASLPPAPRIWLHAVSLGEVTAASALVRALRVRYPHAALLITTATPTGRARAQALFGESVEVRYLPYDTPGAVRRFFERVRPTLAIILETELWPNLFRECAARGVPLLLASARISARSVSRYRRFRALFGGLLAERVTVAAQTAGDGERFIAVGADPRQVHTVGNIKFDLQIEADLLARGRELRAQILGARPVWVAGSTHAGEEDQVLDAHAKVCDGMPDVLLVLVPRHPQRFDSVAGLLARRGCRFERRSAGVPVQAGTQVLLLDSVGELMSFYAGADIAFVGGSLVPSGGHNLLEPAALGVPVLTGPSHGNAEDIAQLLLREGAAREVAGANKLADAVRELLADPALRRQIGARAAQIVEQNRGSVARLVALIEPLLPGQ
jgi:3-deoxy-D-manno-octulosonic-acid transferase